MCWSDFPYAIFVVLKQAYPIDAISTLIDAWISWVTTLRVNPFAHNQYPLIHNIQGRKRINHSLIHMSLIHHRLQAWLSLEVEDHL